MAKRNRHVTPPHATKDTPLMATFSPYRPVYLVLRGNMPSILHSPKPYYAAFTRKTSILYRSIATTPPHHAAKNISRTVPTLSFLQKHLPQEKEHLTTIPFVKKKTLTDGDIPHGMIQLVDVTGVHQGEMTLQDALRRYDHDTHTLLIVDQGQSPPICRVYSKKDLYAKRKSDIAIRRRKANEGQEKLFVINSTIAEGDINTLVKKMTNVLHQGFRVRLDVAFSKGTGKLIREDVIRDASGKRIKGTGRDVTSRVSVKEKIVERVTKLHEGEAWREMDEKLQARMDEEGAGERVKRRQVRITAEKETIARSHVWFQAVRVE